MTLASTTAEKQRQETALVTRVRAYASIISENLFRCEVEDEAKLTFVLPPGNTSCLAPGGHIPICG
jgi:hypothetical protein